MLIVPDRQLLGDKFLRNDEALAAEVEKIEAFKRKNFTIYDEDTLKNQAMRSGEQMLAADFIYLVQEMNPTIWVEQQINFADDWGLYTEHGGKKIYLTSFRKSWLTEWSYFEMDRQQLADRRILGWRNCLVELLAKGAVEWEQVMEYFDDPYGTNAYRWQQYTAIFRNEDCCAKVEKNMENKFLRT